MELSEKRVPAWVRLPVRVTLGDSVSRLVGGVFVVGVQAPSKRGAERINNRRECLFLVMILI